MWVLRGFERACERLLSERLMEGITVETVRSLWNLPEEDPAYDSYPVSPAIANSLQETLSIELNLDFAEEEYLLEFEV